LKWSLVLSGLCLLAAAAGILESDAADVFLEATRPDFQKIPLGVVSIENNGGPDWLGGRLEEVLKKDVKRSLVFELMDLPSLGIKVRDVGNGYGNGSKAVFKQAAENGVSVLVWGKAGLKKGEKEDDVNMEGFVYDSGSDEIVGGKRYAGSPSVVRLMAHRFADELVFRYTGEPGIARTKIAYVSAHGAARELFVMDYDGYDADRGWVPESDAPLVSGSAVSGLYRLPRSEYPRYRYDRTGHWQALDSSLVWGAEHHSRPVAGWKFPGFCFEPRGKFRVVSVRYQDEGRTASDNQSGRRTLSQLVSNW
jgi:hypothetical protein